MKFILKNDAETKSIYCADRRMIVLPQDTYQKEGYILSGWSDGQRPTQQVRIMKWVQQM